MRIVYLHQYLNPGTAAAGIRSLALTEMLAARGHDVHVVTSTVNRPRGETGSVSRLGGTTVHWIPLEYSNTMGYRRRLLAFAAFALRASLVARRLRGDLVFATSTPLTIVIPAAVARIGRSVPFVFEVRDLWPELPIAVGALRGRLAIWAARTLERYAYRSATRIVALSPGMRDGVRAIHPTADVVVVPNMAFPELLGDAGEAGAAWRRAQPWLGDRRMVIYCGTLGRINGVDYLVRVALEAKRLGARTAYVVVGSGAEHDRIRALAEQAGVLGDTFHMLDPVPKDRMAALYGAADICLSLFLPLEEMEANSANKFFDALAAGKPIAINYGGWQARIIRERGAGLVLDPGSPHGAALAIEAALADPAALESMSMASARLGREDYAASTLGARFVEALEGAALRSGALLDDASSSGSTTSSPRKNHSSLES